MKEFNDPNILIVDNFISDEDCQFAIDFYNSYLNQGLFNKYDNNRISIVNPKLKEVDYLINKYLPKINIYFYLQYWRWLLCSHRLSRITI